MLPDRLIPIRGPTLESLSTPDVVDEYIDMAVLGSDLIGQGAHLLGVKMVNGYGDANAAKLRDQIGPSPRSFQGGRTRSGASLSSGRCR